jgi:Kef-type K+ transport system membrane component KefB
LTPTASDLFFLPEGVPIGSRLLWLGVLVLAAMVSGELCERWLRLPRLLGYVLAGVALGPQVAAVVSTDTLFDLRLLFHVTLGLVLFELGQRVDLRWLKHNPWLLATSLAEAALSFAAVLLFLSLLGVRPVVGAIASAIAVASSPAVITTLARDLRAQGQVTERLLMLTALNCVYAYLALSMLFAWSHLEYREGWRVVVLHPIYLIGGSLVLALALAGFALWLMRTLGKRQDTQFVCVVALVLVAIALANGLKMPVVLTLLAFGVLMRTLDRDRNFAHLSLGRSGTLATAVLFSLTGASLDFSQLSSAWIPALGVVAVRVAGKALAVFALAPASALSLRKASLLSIGLVPMSGLALMLMQDTLSLYPAFGADLAPVMYSAIVMMELLGPLAVQFALRRAGETGERNG